MARLELGADGMVRFDGRIIAEIAYFDPEFADIVTGANEAYDELVQFKFAHTLLKNSEVVCRLNAILEKAGWWKS